MDDRVPVDAGVATASPPEAEELCYHCGESCQQETVHTDDKAFCCQGCAMVYRIIQENDLDDFYAIADTPGSSLARKERMDYTWLEDEETIERLLSFRQDGTARVMFQLPQIHCASCVWLLEKLYRLNPGIVQTRVNFNRRELSIVFKEEEISLRELVELLDKIGYRPAIQLADIESGSGRVIHRRLIYQLGVAGFAFGNIMLFSFPEYLGLNADLDGELGRYFGYLNLALALPVMFFSATDYFRSAWAGIRIREINMDIPISLGILAIFLRSTYEVLWLGGPGYFDSMAGLVFFMLVGKWFQQKSFDRLAFDRDYKSYFPVSATLEDGRTRSLNQLQPGDRILVRNRELIPADGVLLTEQAQIDYSFVTGESEPVQVPAGSKVYAGGRQVGAQILVQTTHSVQQSYLTQLWNEQSMQRTDTGRASRIARVMGTWFTWVVLTIAFATLSYWLWADSSKALHAFSSVLIIACPCAIALAIPFIMGNGVRILGRNLAYVRTPQVIEQLASSDQLVLDKTGTITYAERSAIEWRGEPLETAEEQAISALARQSIHPLSRNLVRHLGPPPRALQVDQFQEEAGRGLTGRIGTRLIELGRLREPEERAATGQTLVEVAIDGTYRGAFVFTPEYRPGLSDTLDDLRGDLDIHLVSGDQPVDVDHLSRLIGGREKLHFLQHPQDKLHFVRKQQDQGGQVIMIGDGLNDAGALKQSDVGVVITESLNNFTPASDMILSADRFRRLPDILRLSRRLVRHVYFAYGLALIYNVVGLSFAVQAELSPIIAAILMPASSITVVIYAWIASYSESLASGVYGE